MGAGRRVSHHISSAFYAEAVAALHAVTLLSDLGFRRAVVEGDSLAVIRKLRSPVDDFSEISVIIHDIKARSTEFEGISFQHTFRPLNLVAHLIAGDVRFNSGDRFWVEEVPDGVTQAVQDDWPPQS
ncbi:hypothetical protein HRI_000332100 [Hibiscus trionum]|uniref:RNase H type-1 domain-containing protein n=1 Tax=Hibiscus trionum TaxID=183268 RepID=A0A9W7GWR4_HIBTR|nr:hypothetical protein HRI_000332100 [Hibiscus trionum]